MPLSLENVPEELITDISEKLSRLTEEDKDILRKLFTSEKRGLAVFSKPTKIQENPPKSIQVLGEM